MQYRTIFLVLLLFKICLYIFYTLHIQKAHEIAKDQPISNDIEYINNINIVDINSLFDLLHDKESQYEQQLENLNVLSFKSLIDEKYKKNSTRNNIASKEFEKEIRLYLRVDEKRVQATDTFVTHLKNIANKHTKPVGTKYAVYPAIIDKVL